MGTKRRVATWYQRRKGEYVVLPPGWKPRDGELVFTTQGQMMAFAKASKLMLRQVGMTGKGVAM